MENEEGIVRNEGIDRRRLLKRGAVVGGTLLWAAPLIQTIGPAAQAHEVSPRVSGCCECTGCPPPFGNAAGRRCTANGCDEDGCRQFCNGGGCSGSTNHCGPNPITCDEGVCGAH